MEWWIFLLIGYGIYSIFGSVILIIGMHCEGGFTMFPKDFKETFSLYGATAVIAFILSLIQFPFVYLYLLFTMKKWKQSKE